MNEVPHFQGPRPKENIRNWAMPSSIYRRFFKFYFFHYKVKKKKLLRFLLKKIGTAYWTFFLYLKEGGLIKYLLYWLDFPYMHLAKIIILW